MTKTVDEMLTTILKNEGGYVDIPQDHGGATNFGVTIGEYGVYLGHTATKEEVKNMPIAHAKDIFRKKYFEKPGIDKIDPELQPIVFDASVLYGPSRAIKFLQEVIRVDADGKIGPNTIEKAKLRCAEMGAWAVVNAYVQKRIDFCKAIVANNPSQKIFLKGWINRANSFYMTGQK